MSDSGASTQEEVVLRSTPLGKWLRKLRIDLEISQAEMAGQLLISPSRLSRVETSDGWLPRETLQNLVTRYGLKAAAAQELYRLSEQYEPTVTVPSQVLTRRVLQDLADRLAKAAPAELDDMLRELERLGCRPATDDCLTPLQTSGQVCPSCDGD